MMKMKKMKKMKAQEEKECRQNHPFHLLVWLFEDFVPPREERGLRIGCCECAIHEKSSPRDWHSDEPALLRLPLQETLCCGDSFSSSRIPTRLSRLIPSLSKVFLVFHNGARRDNKPLKK